MSDIFTVLELLIIISSINRHFTWYRDNNTHMLSALSKRINTNSSLKNLLEIPENTNVSPELLKILFLNIWETFKDGNRNLSLDQVYQKLQQHVEALIEHINKKQHDKKLEAAGTIVNAIKKYLQKPLDKRVKIEFNDYINQVEISSTGVDPSWTNHIGKNRLAQYQKTSREEAEKLINQVRKGGFNPGLQSLQKTKHYRAGNCGDQAVAMAHMLNRRKNKGVAHPVGLINEDHAFVLYDTTGISLQENGVFNFIPGTVYVIDPWKGTSFPFTKGDIHPMNLITQTGQLKKIIFNVPKGNPNIDFA
ncbi:hypothetical protein E4K63_00910 [Allofrancisella inopinata]|uniref:Transglutaminase superfamily protein n=1 Tax=Allofrancisella inopinata TaxID=1085647 RepID=A0AAE6YGJ1_9GAMM|nr:hypothetical protein [Allofrancisella inopinata]QIV95473.1 hypothetical protein E4K63_00910 [Allofrancisella inopinata]